MFCAIYFMNEVKIENVTLYQSMLCLINQNRLLHILDDMLSTMTCFLRYLEMCALINSSKNTFYLLEFIFSQTLNSLIWLGSHISKPVFTRLKQNKTKKTFTLLSFCKFKWCSLSYTVRIFLLIWNICLQQSCHFLLQATLISEKHKPATVWCLKRTL